MRILIIKLLTLLFTSELVVFATYGTYLNFIQRNYNKAINFNLNCALFNIIIAFLWGLL